VEFLFLRIFTEAHFVF